MTGLSSVRCLLTSGLRFKCLSDTGHGAACTNTRDENAGRWYPPDLSAVVWRCISGLAGLLNC